MNVIHTPYIHQHIPPPSDPDKCPKCSKEEDVVQVCKHCRYEYPEEECNAWAIALGIAILILILAISSWVVSIIGTWFLESSSGTTLVEVIKNHWEWLTNLRVW